MHSLAESPSLEKTDCSFLSCYSYSFPVASHLEAGPCEVPIYALPSAGIGIVQVLFRQ